MRRIWLCILCLFLVGCGEEDSLESAEVVDVQKVTNDSPQVKQEYPSISAVKFNNDKVFIKEYFINLLQGLMDGSVEDKTGLFISDEVFRFIKDLKVTVLDDIEFLIYPIEVSSETIIYIVELTLVRPDPFTGGEVILSTEQLFSILEIDNEGVIRSCELYTTNTSHPEFLIWDYDEKVSNE